MTKNTVVVIDDDILSALERAGKLTDEGAGDETSPNINPRPNETLPDVWVPIESQRPKVEKPFPSIWGMKILEGTEG